MIADDIAVAIAEVEGWFTPGTLAQRNNNPGNLRRWGSLPTSGGFAVFASADAGWQALRRQVELNIGRGLSLDQFFGGGNGYDGYAPAKDSNRPDVYARTVGAKVGIPTSVPIRDATAWSGVPDITIIQAPQDSAPLLLAAAAIAAVFLLA